MKIAVGVVVLVLLAILAVVIFRSRMTWRRRLTPDESQMRALVGEVYGTKITAESITFKAGDAILSVTLRDEKVTSLEVNLSNLARKLREGLSPAVIKLGLKF
jgi:hypothetical protein